MTVIEPQKLSLTNWPDFKKVVLLFDEKRNKAKVGFLMSIDSTGFNFNIGIEDDYFEVTHFEEFQINF